MGLHRRLLLWAGMLFLFLGLSLTPTQAKAGSCADCVYCIYNYGYICPGDIAFDFPKIFTSLWEGMKSAWAAVKKNSVLIQLIDDGIRTITLWKEKLAEVLDLEKVMESLKMLGDNILARLEIKRMEARNAAYAHASATGVQFERALKQADPLASDQFLCNMLVARQAVPAGQEFADMVTLIIARGLDEGLLAQGNGPLAAAYDYKQNCEDRTGNPIDGASEKCAAPSAHPGTGTADFHMSYDTLSRDRVYTLPPAKLVDYTANGVTRKVLQFVPDPQDESQRRWLMAAQYCKTLAGPDPSGPQGQDVKKPKGLSENRQMHECRAKRMELMTKCAARLAKLTRPDCSNKDYDGFCQLAVDACAAAKDAQLNLGSAYQNCQNGLSLYQLENVSVRLCGSTRRLQSARLQGVSEPETVAVLAECKRLKQSWEEQLDIEEQSLRKASEGIINNKACFAGINN